MENFMSFWNKIFVFINNIPMAIKLAICITFATVFMTVYTLASYAISIYDYNMPNNLVVVKVSKTDVLNLNVDENVNAT